MTRRAWATLLVVLAGAAILLPGLTWYELRAEEGRRAWVAREMVQHGHWIVPTIWGRPYLAKPPLHGWSIAALSWLGGEVTRWTVRLPSVLASLLAAVLLGVLGWRRLGARGGLAAAALLLTAPLFVEKARLGEIEALLGLTVFVAVWGLGAAVEQERWASRSIASGVALAAALLTKGPPALVFHLGAALGLAVLMPDRRRRVLLATLASLGVAVVLAGAWVVALLASVPSGLALTRWTAEMSRAGNGGALVYLRERVDYVVGTVGGMVPATLVLLLCWRRGAWRALARQSASRLAVAVVVPAWLFFLVFPGTSPRYAYPLLPWVAWLGAARLRTVLETEHGAALARLRLAATVVGGVVAVAGVALLCAPWLAPIDGHLGAAVAAVSAVGFGVAAVLRLRAHERSAAEPSTAMPAGLALLALGLAAAWSAADDLVAQRLASDDQACATAASIESAVPRPATLYVLPWEHWNLLFAVHRDLLACDVPDEVPAGGYLLINHSQLADLPARFHAVAEVHHHRWTLVVVQASDGR